MSTSRYIIVLALFALVAAGCTSTSSLTSVMPSATFPNRLPLRIRLNVPMDLQNHTVVSSVSGNSCGAYTAKVDAGHAYLGAIRTALEASVESVAIAGTAVAAADSMFDAQVTVVLSGESAALQANSGFITTSVTAQFQTSLTLTFADRSGKSIYLYTANGSGFATDNILSCGGIAEVLRQAAEKGLRQVADYISQSTFSAQQLNVLVKAGK